MEKDEKIVIKTEPLSPMELTPPQSPAVYAEELLLPSGSSPMEMTPPVTPVYQNIAHDDYIVIKEGPLLSSGSAPMDMTPPVTPVHQYIAQHEHITIMEEPVLPSVPTPMEMTPPVTPAKQDIQHVGIRVLSPPATPGTSRITSTSRFLTPSPEPKPGFNMEFEFGEDLIDPIIIPPNQTSAADSSPTHPSIDRGATCMKRVHRTAEAKESRFYKPWENVPELKDKVYKGDLPYWLPRDERPWEDYVPSEVESDNGFTDPPPESSAVHIVISDSDDLDPQDQTDAGHTVPSPTSSPVTPRQVPEYPPLLVLDTTEANFGFAATDEEDPVTVQVQGESFYNIRLPRESVSSDEAYRVDESNRGSHLSSMPEDQSAVEDDGEQQNMNIDDLIVGVEEARIARAIPMAARLPIEITTEDINDSEDVARHESYDIAAEKTNSSQSDQDITSDESIPLPVHCQNYLRDLQEAKNRGDAAGSTSGSAGDGDSDQTQGEAEEEIDQSQDAEEEIEQSEEAEEEIEQPEEAEEEIEQSEEAEEEIEQSEEAEIEQSQEAGEEMEQSEEAEIEQSQEAEEEIEQSEEAEEEMDQSHEGRSPVYEPQSPGPLFDKRHSFEDDDRSKGSSPEYDWPPYTDNAGRSRESSPSASEYESRARRDEERAKASTAELECEELFEDTAGPSRVREYASRSSAGYGRETYEENPGTSREFEERSKESSPEYGCQTDGDNDNEPSGEEQEDSDVQITGPPIVSVEHVVYYEPEPMEPTSDCEEEVQCVCLDDESDLTTSSDEEAIVHAVSHSDEEMVSPKKRRSDAPFTPSSASKRQRVTNVQAALGVQDVEMEAENPAGVNLWLNSFTAWTGSERNKAIELLIKKCSADQVRHMMTTIEPLFQRDFISHLPKEVALQILKKLSPVDLLRAAQTSRYWRFLSEDNLLWKEQCQRIGISTISRRIKLMPLTFASSWKAEYMRNKYIEHKWLTKPMSSAKILKAHDDHVITCLQFYGNVILSGSDDTTLKLWSAVTGKCLRTLVGHTGGVWSSQMYKKTVISGSTDRTLRVWDADSGVCLKILTGHTSTVRCMHLHEDRVVSGSRDATLRVWSVSEGQCLKVLVGHLAAVRCVQYDGKLVVSGAYDYYVKVWNPDSGECLHTLSGHTNRVYSLQFDGQHIVSGSLDTSIIVWDVTSGSVKHTLTGHQSLTSGMELRDNILVSGNADSTVKVWDIITGQCLHTLAGPHKHQSAVTCLQLNNRFVITSSDDGTVKLWDVKTGEFIRNLVTLESGGSGGVVWRIRASQTKLVCAVGSRNGTEETKLMVMNFDVPSTCQACQ